MSSTSTVQYLHLSALAYGDSHVCILFTLNIK